MEKDEKEPVIIQGEGDLFDLTKMAEAGYEIHGKVHEEIVAWTRMKWMFVGLLIYGVEDIIGAATNWW